MKLSRAGIPGLSPFLSLISLTIYEALVPSVNGSPVHSAQ